MPSRRPLLHRLLQHNYVGPGNAIDSAEPVDAVDQVARDHDILYQAIEQSGVNLEAVNSADTNSAREFIDVGVRELRSGSVSSGLLGVASGIALNGKAAFENLIGKPVYPKMAPARPHKKKDSTPNPLDQSANRVFRITGFQKANLKRAELKLKNMLKNPKKFDDAAIAAQKKKIDDTKASWEQHAGASNYHKEAISHRKLIEEMADIDFSMEESVLETPPDSRAEGTLDDDSLGGAGPDPKRSRIENVIEAPIDTSDPLCAN